MTQILTTAYPSERIATRAKQQRVPPLETGDRLTRVEFERRYQAMPHVKKAELIEGVVFIGSPVRYTHGKPHGIIMGWLATYCAGTPGVEFADNVTMRLDIDNVFQPDALLRLRSELGGQSRVGKDDYLEGAPELIVEIAGSSASYDLYDKLPVYRRTGVQEYLVWQVYDNKLDWLFLDEGRYIPLIPDAQGEIHSRTFPGLVLPVAALLAEDLAAVLATAQKGLSQPEHKEFVVQYQQEQDNS